MYKTKAREEHDILIHSHRIVPIKFPLGLFIPFKIVTIIELKVKYNDQRPRIEEYGSGAPSSVSGEKH
ncbi:hypothetical protein JW935_11785 [candidate division KSB1 bacterium]|nr:hypothetical protein [candidate division KSB1 bacterium]